MPHTYLLMILLAEVCTNSSFFYSGTFPGPSKVTCGVRVFVISILPHCLAKNKDNRDVAKD